MKTETRALNRDAIKYIAIIAMTLNHVASVFMEPGTWLYESFTDIGYMTAIIMCYFLADGYHYTHSKDSYCRRLLIFAAISQIPFNLALGVFSLNILFTLLICFAIIWVMENVSGSTQRNLFVTGLTVLSVIGDWGIFAAIFTIIFERRRGNKGQYQILISFCYCALVFGLFEYLDLSGNYGYIAAIPHVIFETLPLVAAGLMMEFLYNGRKSDRNQTFNKWFFYVYYPTHLLVLAGIKALMG